MCDSCCCFLCVSENNGTRYTSASVRQGTWDVGFLTHVTSCNVWLLNTTAWGKFRTIAFTKASASHTVLTPADNENHIDKHEFKVPFVCGARNLGEALRRIAEGAAMIRTKGEAGTGVLCDAFRD